MLNDQEASLLRNLGNRRERVIEAQNAVVVKLESVVQHLEQCYSDPQMTQTRFANTVLRWHKLLTLLAEGAASEAREFVRVAADNLTPEELDEHEPGGYIKDRLIMLNAARGLSTRSLIHLEAVATLMNDWLGLAGLEPSGDKTAAG